MTGPIPTSLKATLILNLLWSALILASAGYLLLQRGGAGSWLPLALSLTFFLNTCAAFHSRLALLLVLVFTLLFLLRWLPMVAVNVWMFSTDHPLYLDSPGTIMIVAVYAVLFAIPALIFSIAYLLQWRSLLAALRKPTRGMSRATQCGP